MFSADAANAYSGLSLDASNYITAGLTIGSGLSFYRGARLRLLSDNIVLEIVTNAPVFTLGISLVVGSNGVYSVNFVSPAWTFTGDLAQDLTNRTVSSGSDNIGAYSEIDFNYASAVPHSAGIRLYNDSPVVTFNDMTLAGARMIWHFRAGQVIPQ